MAIRSKVITDGLSAIRKELDAVCSMGYNQQKVFADWLALMFFAYLKDDPAYLKIMRDYRNEAPVGQREADHFAMAHACLLEYMGKTNNEALSGLYMEYAPNTNIGQFFTSYNLSEAICNLTLTDIPKERKFTVYDPTCGAGIFFIASAKIMTLEENGRAIFIGQDLDINCCRMCALNLMFFNLNGVIIHGNTLSMQIKDTWATKRNVLYGGSLQHIDPESVKKWYLAPAKDAIDNKAVTPKKEKPTVVSGQFSLFN